MTQCALQARFFLLLFLAFSLVGCSQFKRGAVSEEKDPHLLEARKRSSAMDWDGAIQYYEKALLNNPTNATAHFEVGVIYDVRKQDFTAAMYHYERHIKLRPNTPSAERAEQNVIACKRQLAKTVSYEFVPRDMQKELERFAQTNSLLERQISQLRQEMARRPQYVTNYVTNYVQVHQFEQRGSSRLTQPAAMVEPPETFDSFPEPEYEQPRPQPAPRAAPATQAAQVRPQNRTTTPNPSTAANNRSTGPSKTHRVRPGDTLEVVARRYGVSVAALKAANPTARNGARAGQELVIPQR